MTQSPREVQKCICMKMFLDHYCVNIQLPILLIQHRVVEEPGVYPRELGAQDRVHPVHHIAQSHTMDSL